MNQTKRFLICTVRSDGRQEIHDHTNLASEVPRFEMLGFSVIPAAVFEPEDVQIPGGAAA